MSISRRSRPGEAGAAIPTTKTASNSSPLAWWIGHHLDAHPLARARALAAEPDLGEPRQGAARPRGVERRRRGRRSRGRAAPAPPARRGAPPPPRRPPRRPPGAGRSGRSRRAGRRRAAARRPRAPPRRGRRRGAVAPLSRATRPSAPDHRAVGGGRGRDRVGESCPRDAVARVGADAQVLLHRRRGRTAARSQATAARTSRRSKSPMPPRTWCGHARALERLDDRPRLQADGAHQHRLLLEGDALAGQPQDLARPPPGPGRRGRARARSAARGPVGVRQGDAAFGARSAIGATTAVAASRIAWSSGG